MTTDMKTMQLASECQTEDAATWRRAQLSALADGQLQGVAFADALALFDHESNDGGQARAAWHTLHVVGDVLRSNELADCSKDVVFLARLTTALQQEPRLKPGLATSSVPGVDAAPVIGQMTSIAGNSLEPSKAAVAKDSANEPVFHWKWVAGLSSVAAALAISWNLVGGTTANSEAQLAQVAVPAAVSKQTTASAEQTNNVVANNAINNDTSTHVMLRNPQLDAMIAAHSQLGGSSALQMPSGFLRNATFDAASSGVAR